MVTIFKYRNMPTYLGKMHERAHIKGRKKIKTYEDEKNCLVGFTDGEDIYCIPIANVREYYYALYAGCQSLKSEAELYGQNVLDILGKAKKDKRIKLN